MKELTIEQKAEAYDKGLQKSKEFYTLCKKCGAKDTVDFLESLFPELSKSEDERIRKRIYNYINVTLDDNESTEKEKWLAWLEKQDNSDKSLYIRFGDIPTNGKSKVYNGEIEIGIEEGISVYPAFEDKEGNIILGLNLPITKTSLHTQQHLLEYDNRPCYLVTGDYVGKGTDGEPLIKNVRIIKEIKPYRIKQDKENNTYIINNTPNCGISVYNEELKDSADERIRKSLITFFQRFPYGSLESAGTNPKEAIAWLERQSKHKLTHEDICKSYNIPDIGEFSDGYHTFNGLYKQRMILFAVLVKTYKDRAWKSWRHEDGENCFGGGWFIVGIDTPAGTYTYHYEAKDWDMFDCQILYRAKHWDGHNENDVERLFSLIEPQGKTALEAVREEKVEHLVPQKGEYYICIKDYCLASNYLVNTKDKIYKSPRNGYINNDKGVGLSWTNSCTENYFRPVKEEDWIVCEQNNIIGKPLQYKEFMSELIQKNIKSLEDKSIVPNFRLWDISDAKNGDILNSPSHKIIWIYKDSSHYHACVNMNYTTRNVARNGLIGIPSDTCPATKDECTILFANMKKEGFEWNEAKKELEKIESNSAWSDEDEKRLKSCLNILQPKTLVGNIETINTKWLKSLKERIKE